MENVKKNIEQLSDEDLIIQYTRCADQYTEDAIEYLREEIKKRNLSLNDTEEYSNSGSESIQLTEEDFSQLDHSFNKIDIELVAAMLRDENILFFIDNPSSSNTLPIESEADRQFTIHIHKNSLEKSHKLIDEHFEKEGGKYLLKNRTVADQLRILSFNILRISEAEAAEQVEVDFSDEEKKFLIDQGNQILKDADIIEKEKEKIIFFYDNVEPLVAKLEKSTDYLFSKSELLTALEILQIAVVLDTFQNFMEDATKTLLDMFIP